MTKAFESLHVLVVDDDETQRELTLVHLFRLGIKNCMAAVDGQEALVLLQDQNRTFDIVFTDNQMPIMDGPDLIRNIRADPFLTHLKLVMVSDNLSGSQFKSAAEMTLREFLTEHQVRGYPKTGLTRNALESILYTLLDE